MIGGLLSLLLCQLAGEALARALGLPVPGPVLGLALLLLAHLGLLFVPAGVGVVMHLEVLAGDAGAIALAVLGGTLLAIGVTGLLAQRWLSR